MMTFIKQFHEGVIVTLHFWFMTYDLLFFSFIRMSANNHVFVEWEERIISKERGYRVVHYYLNESNGNSVLAIVGIEKSLRHMIYVLSEDFVINYGCTITVRAGTKWRARRDVGSCQ